MDNFEINYDLRPYLPDIFMAKQIYNSSDTINNNNNININSTIFIFNLKNENLTSIYNDPNYMLFGNKNPSIITPYIYPSLFYFYNKNTSSINYKILNTSYILTESIKLLLENIGYIITNVDMSIFQYQELLIYETITMTPQKIIYLYFSLNDYTNIGNMVNYNNYSSSVFYNKKYWNILICPYLNETIPILSTNIKYIYTSNNTSNNTTNNTRTKKIQTIDFDERENISYLFKIDYKYFENINFTKDTKSYIEILKNYSLYIQNYVEYIKNQTQKITINHNLNEISKIYYVSSDYASRQVNNYTDIILNKQHVNKYTNYSANENKYSFSTDCKFGNLKQLQLSQMLQPKYSCYNYDISINPTLYQQVINYNLSSYYNINSTNLNNMTMINSNLYKFFLLINPLIININYLLQNVVTTIEPLFENQNTLTFGTNQNKLQLSILNDIIPSSLYYINKYKITFQFVNSQISQTTNSSSKSQYIIILNIAFYNGDNISIVNKDITATNNTLGYINYGIMEQTISLSPTINIFQNNMSSISLTLAEQMTKINILDIKKYNYSLNYSFCSPYKNALNNIYFYNFYTLISNINTPLKTYNNQYYNNVLNTLMIKINNFIKNYININDNFNFLLNDTKNTNETKNYICPMTLYDDNIIISNDNTNFKYIEYFDYFPKINLSNPSLKYNKITGETFFNYLPAGKYLKFNYTNYKYNQITITEEVILSVKNVADILNYNFSLLFLLPYDINLDDSKYSDTELYSDNYSMNISSNHTNIYIVITDNLGNIYNFNGFEENYGFIYAIKLFDYPNYSSANLYLPILLNMYFNKYINLSQFVIITETYKKYTDTNMVYWDINNSYLKTHNTKELKDIVFNDFKRFQNTNDIKKLYEDYYKNFSSTIVEKLVGYKLILRNLKYSLKILVYLSNLRKIILLLNKCYNYCVIIKINMIMNDNNNNNLIKILKYNANTISYLILVNYNLDISDGPLTTIFYNYLFLLCNVNKLSTLEEINNCEKNITYCIDYSLEKLNIISKTLFSIDENNLYYEVFNNIYNYICEEQINFWIIDEINFDIDNFFQETNLNNFSGENLLIKQIISFMKIIFLNTNKINELYYLSNLMTNNIYNINVVKNYYIYDQNNYTTQTNIPIFDVVQFLLDMKQIIINISSNPLNINYEQYLKAVNQNIIIYLDNIISYFNQITNKINSVYTSMLSNPPSPINIYDPTEIADFYFILSEFINSYETFYKLLFENNINVYNEYNSVKLSFDNLVAGCEEFLLYICLVNDFTCPQNVINSNIYVNEDLYKIIKSDIFYNFMIKTIDNFINILIEHNAEIILNYVDKISLTKINNLSNNLSNYPLKKQYINMITKIISNLKNNISTDVVCNLCYIIPYQDLLLFDEIFNKVFNFSWATFNFNENLTTLINQVNLVSDNVLNYYYDGNENNIIYKTIINYTYLNTLYKYVNIDNIDNVDNSSSIN